MLGQGLIKRAVATFVAAGASFVSVVALGATVFYLLLLVVTPLISAALTALLFALVATVVALVFLRRARGDDQEDDYDDEPEGMVMRALHMFQKRPIMGAAAALAGGFVFLRNPALVTMIAAAFSEKSRNRRRR